MSALTTIGRLVNSRLRRQGWELTRVDLTYIGARSIVHRAHRDGVSVREYVERMFDEKGASAAVVEEMKRAECIESKGSICEIGPGSGRYLDAVLDLGRPTSYDIYEPAADWAAWLEKNYPVTVKPSDRRTLAPSPDDTYDLVHAHGVFVYIRLIDAFHYFEEMARVCKGSGSIVFDFFPAEDFSADVIERWLTTSDRYPVVLPSATVREFFARRSYELVHRFDHPLGEARSTYMLFKGTNSRL